MTHITCYPIPTAFAAREPPSIWLPGTGTDTVRSTDSCQRAGTLGADYRGDVATAEGGLACQKWGSHIPRVRLSAPRSLEIFSMRGPENSPDYSEFL